MGGSARGVSAEEGRAAAAEALLAAGAKSCGGRQAPLLAAARWGRLVGGGRWGWVGGVGVGWVWFGWGGAEFEVEGNVVQRVEIPHVRWQSFGFSFKVSLFARSGR